MVHFDLQDLLVQICRAQIYEIKFKIQQKRPDTRQVKKKRKVDLGDLDLSGNIKKLKDLRSLGQW